MIIFLMGFEPMAIRAQGLQIARIVISTVSVNMINVELDCVLSHETAFFTIIFFIQSINMLRITAFPTQSIVDLFAKSVLTL